ncbi:hypothetical protein PVK06_026625 [Gossypium arboreum]|uniref:Retrotransposon gag domain-containing protein n=1 Tax=Gossypium arboreum TaxID=29729 RepID=A0ABR0NY50_GOSAR|nr:hypothetical protein PVK06_026625 [Gossypium arboreum]
MDIDLTLREEQHAPLTAESTLNVMRDFERPRVSLTKLRNVFAKNDKVEMTPVMTSLMSIKYKGQGNVRDYITEMFHVASRLKALKIELSE